MFADIISSRRERQRERGEGWGGERAVRREENADYLRWSAYIREINALFLTAETIFSEIACLRRKETAVGLDIFLAINKIININK